MHRAPSPRVRSDGTHGEPRRRRRRRIGEARVPPIRAPRTERERHRALRRHPDPFSRVTDAVNFILRAPRARALAHLM